MIDGLAAVYTLKVELKHNLKGVYLILDDLHSQPYPSEEFTESLPLLEMSKRVQT